MDTKRLEQTWKMVIAIINSHLHCTCTIFIVLSIIYLQYFTMNFLSPRRITYILTITLKVVYKYSFQQNWCPMNTVLNFAIMIVAQYDQSRRISQILWHRSTCRDVHVCVYVHVHRCMYIMYIGYLGRKDTVYQDFVDILSTILGWAQYTKCVA